MWVYCVFDGFIYVFVEEKEFIPWTLILELLPLLWFWRVIVSQRNEFIPLEVISMIAFPTGVLTCIIPPEKEIYSLGSHIYDCFRF